MPCLHPSLLTSVGLSPLVFLVFCRNGLQSVYSIKHLSLLTIFSNESWFLLRDLSPVVSRVCCSKPLTIHFKHGKTTTYYGCCGTLLRQGWVSFRGEVFRKGKSRGEQRLRHFFFVPVRQFMWKVSWLHSCAGSKVARYLKHSPADPCELSFVQILVKQVFWPKSAPAQHWGAGFFIRQVILPVKMHLHRALQPMH